jgi:hypothetical protein
MLDTIDRTIDYDDMKMMLLYRSYWLFGIKKMADTRYKRKEKNEEVEKMIIFGEIQLSPKNGVAPSYWQFVSGLRARGDRCRCEMRDARAADKREKRKGPTTDRTGRVNKQQGGS